jgi:hypothetical protein
MSAQCPNRAAPKEAKPEGPFSRHLPSLLRRPCGIGLVYPGKLRASWGNVGRRLRSALCEAFPGRMNLTELSALAQGPSIVRKPSVISLGRSLRTGASALAV